MIMNNFSLVKIKFFATIVPLFFNLFSFAANPELPSLKFPQIQNVGEGSPAAITHPVFYISPKMKIKKEKGGLGFIVFRKIISKWGTETFVVGISKFLCANNGNCRHEGWVPVKTYESCTLVSGGNNNQTKVKCSKKRNCEDGSSQQQYPSNYEIQSLYGGNEEIRNSSNGMCEVEFPERSSQEYWDYPSGSF